MNKSRLSLEAIWQEVLALKRRVSSVSSTSGSGTVTTTGSPGSGNLAKFSGATSVTNADLTGDVTTSGGVATTIAGDAVGNSKLANMAAATLKGRAAGGGTGDPQDLSADDASDVLDTAADPFLRTSAAGGSAITQLTGDVTAGPGGGSQAATIAADAVTNAKAANMAQSTIKGRAAAAGTGDPTDLTPNQVSTILDGATDPFLRTSAASSGITQLTGDVTAGPGSGSQASTIANDAVSNAKLANMAQATFKMRAAAAGTGDPIDGTDAQARTALAFEGGVRGQFDGGGAVLIVGSKCYVRALCAFTITQATVTCYPSGSVTLDVKKADYATFPTLTSIVASAPPTVSGAQKSKDTTLTGWTVAVAQDDILEISITAATTATWAAVDLTGPRTT